MFNGNGNLERLDLKKYGHDCTERTELERINQSQKNISETETEITKIEPGHVGRFWRMLCNALSHICLIPETLNEFGNSLATRSSSDNP